jgi:hypothetical protein
VRQRGYRFFRPDVDEHDDHFEVQDLLVKHKTNVGEFTIEMLDLNRKMLQRIRDIRKRLYQSNEAILQGLRSLRNRSIDMLPRTLRGNVLSARKRLEGQAVEAEEFLRDLCKSPLRDPDDEKKERSKGRRALLKKVEAIHPDPWLRPSK